MAPKSNLNQQQLLHSILRQLITHGLKGLTMDLLAAELTMSKRTLYEIFGSKHKLIESTLDYMFSNLHKMCVGIYENAPDTISALAEIMHLQGEMLCMLTIDFFNDMDTLYPEIHEIYKERRTHAHQEWDYIYRRGVQEGVLRADVNHHVIREMISVQMEALKRTEDRFAGQFTLNEIYSTITTGFLRSIASEQGLRILESYKPVYKENQYLSFINQEI